MGSEIPEAHTQEKFTQVPLPPLTNLDGSYIFLYFIAHSKHVVSPKQKKTNQQLPYVVKFAVFYMKNVSIILKHFKRL